jgi:hypothetical protein
MRHLNIIATAAAALIVILVLFGVTLDDHASSSPSYPQTTSSTCTLFLVSGGFTATASATSASGTCAPLTGIIDVLGCPPTTNSSPSVIACPGPQFASFSATGSTTAVVPWDQRVEIDLFGGLPMLQCASPNCSSSASLINSTIYSCCRLADQFIFSVPGDYSFTASWTPGTFGLTACTFVSYLTETSAGSVTSTPYCTSASGTSSAAYSSTQEATFVLSVA